MANILFFYNIDLRMSVFMKEKVWDKYSRLCVFTLHGEIEIMAYEIR